MPPQPKPTVGVSYSWKEERGGPQKEAVEMFCTRLRRAGIEVIRDSDAVELGQSLTDYMHKLGSTDGMAHLCVFLSEPYLKSRDCMYELVVAWQRSMGTLHEFRQRVKVWVTPDTKIYHHEDRKAVTDYWVGARSDLERNLREIVGSTSVAGEAELHRRVVQIAISVSDILTFLADSLSPASEEEFEQWIRASFPELADPKSAPPKRQIPPPPLADGENAYPEVVRKVNGWLKAHAKVATFVGRRAPSWFQDSGSSIQLNKEAGRSRMDLLGPLEAFVRHWDDEPPDRAFVVGFDKILSGMLVLAVDPAWIVQERRFVPHGPLEYAGAAFEKRSGRNRSINCLVLLHRALAPEGTPCRLDDLLIPSHEADERRLPPISKRSASPLKSEKEAEILDDLRRVVLDGIVGELQTGRDPKVVLEELRDQLRQEYESGCPYHADDKGYLPFKQELKLAGLIVELPDAQRSETEFLEKAHLLVKVLHDLQDLMSLSR